MPDFGLWEAINIVCRLGIAAICVVKLWAYFDLYKPLERLGIGIAGGCAFMTIGVFFTGARSPFAEWASALFTVGVLLYFTSRLERQIRHSAANRAHLRERNRPPV